MYPDDNDTIAFDNPAGTGRRRLMILLALLVAGTLALVGTLTACKGGEESGEEEDKATVYVDESAPPEPGLEPVVLEEVPDSQPTPSGFDMGGATQTGTTVDGPCPGVLTDGLVVTPNPVRLLGGQTKGAIDIRNCAAEQVTWNATTVSWVQLAENQAELPSGATFRLLFTVKTTSLPSGDYSFKIKVFRSGQSIYVPVEGVKLGGLVAPGGPTPSPAPTVGGLISNVSACADKCITKAWLTPIIGRADVKLDMRTNVLAKMWARVSTSAPQYSGGKPYFGSHVVNLASGDYRKQWNVVLKPLQPDTKYHIMVVAQDSKGGVSYQVGTFKTTKVISGFANSEPGGCSLNCVKTALLMPKLNSPDLGIEVKTHVPAKMQVYANGVTVASTQGQFRTEWTDTLKLDMGKNYEIKLKVTDQQGHSQEHKALVSTPKPAAGHLKDVRFTIHKIHVTDDADNQPGNRTGELQFRVEVNGQRQSSLDVGEQKVKAPATVNVNKSITVHDPPSVLRFRVQGLERDNNQRGFCSAGSVVYPETSGRKLITNCYELEWNTAEGEIDLTAAPPAGQALPECYGFGDIQADRCYAIEAVGDDPLFTVFVGVTFLG